MDCAPISRKSAQAARADSIHAGRSFANVRLRLSRTRSFFPMMRASLSPMPPAPLRSLPGSRDLYTFLRPLASHHHTRRHLTNWHCQGTLGCRQTGIARVYLVPYRSGTASRKCHSDFSRYGQVEDMDTEPPGLSKRQGAEMILLEMRIYVAEFRRRSSVRYEPLNSISVTLEET